MTQSGYDNLKIGDVILYKYGSKSYEWYDQDIKLNKIKICQHTWS